MLGRKWRVIKNELLKSHTKERTWRETMKKTIIIVIISLLLIVGVYNFNQNEKIKEEEQTQALTAMGNAWIQSDMRNSCEEGCEQNSLIYADFEDGDCFCMDEEDRNKIYPEMYEIKRKYKIQNISLSERTDNRGIYMSSSNSPPPKWEFVK